MNLCSKNIKYRRVKKEITYIMYITSWKTIKNKKKIILSATEKKCHNIWTENPILVKQKPFES